MMCQNRCRRADQLFLISDSSYVLSYMMHHFIPVRLLAASVLATAVLTFGASWASAQSLALSFDDGFNPAAQPQAGQWNAQILATLREHKIKAVLFPSLVRIGGADGLPLVAAWSQEGHLVGNHTASHQSLGDPNVTLAQFIADVQVADEALRELPTFTPMLRFPYLKEGETRAKRDGMRTWMADHGYKGAPVSIDASDWYYNRVFAEYVQAGNSANAERVKQHYIRHVLDRASYYNRLGQDVLGRSPAHVILLHTNQINAATLPDVIAALTANGWTIIPADTAFQDPLYTEAPDTLPAGESVIWARAKLRNLPDLRYPAEDAVYEAPLLRDAGLLP